MCQFRYPPTITLSPSGVALSSCSQNFFFHSLYNPPEEHKHMICMLNTISYNLSSIHITLSPLMLTLIRSSFSSLDSTSPLHSTLAGLHHYGVLNLQPPQLFHFVPLPSTLLHIQRSNLSIISANSLPLRVTVLTFKLPTISNCPNAA